MWFTPIPVKKTPDFSDYFRDLTDFLFLYRFFKRFSLSGSLPPLKKSPVPLGSPIIVLYRKSGKIGFPMPAAGNVFQILNLHSKYIKKKTFFNAHLSKFYPYISHFLTFHIFLHFIFSYISNLLTFHIF